MRYAGFWPRLGAGLVDLVVLAPIIALSFWSMSTRTTALLAEVPLTLFFAFYNIYFVGRWGQTIGKMALGIKVVNLDGTNAGFVRAFYRHSVDLGFSIVTATLNIYALASISSAEFDPLSFAGRMQLLGEHTPRWNDLVSGLTVAWGASELIVLLLNTKRRALHDFIAGTVVIHRGEMVAEA
jgi:uncharacterized RDD family membrane protein YckC